jgi:hypothetical protein
MISGCSALSINSFKFARIKVETLSSNAITPPKIFRLLSRADLQIQVSCAYVAAVGARQTAAARASRPNQYASYKSHAQPEEPATGQETSYDSQHRAQYQSNE